MLAAVFNTSCLNTKHCPPCFALQDHSSSRPFLSLSQAAFQSLGEPLTYFRKKIPFSLLHPEPVPPACYQELAPCSRRTGDGAVLSLGPEQAGDRVAPELLDLAQSSSPESWAAPRVQVVGPGHQRPGPLSATWEAPLAFLWPFQLLVG